jgi:hypothetical protein
MDPTAGLDAVEKRKFPAAAGSQALIAGNAGRRLVTTVTELSRLLIWLCMFELWQQVWSLLSEQSWS